VYFQGQYDAFGGGAIGAGAGADKRSPSFDPGYGFQSSNLGGAGYSQPQVGLVPFSTEDTYEGDHLTMFQACESCTSFRKSRTDKPVSAALQGKQDNLQSATSASSGFGTDVAAPNAPASGGQGQSQLHQQVSP
jgi:hypothetical protein